MDKCVLLSHVVKKSLHTCWNMKDVYSCAILLSDREKAHFTL